jgi:hypothetical protein
MEVAAFKPRLVLVLSGSNWFEPFAEGLTFAPVPSCEMVEWYGEAGGVQWIVGKHPQGKPEGQFLHELERTLASAGGPHLPDIGKCGGLSTPELEKRV